VVGTRYFPLHAGLNELDYTELTVLVEEDFKIEFPDDVAEKFKDINDMVEYVSRSFWAA
jgi:acyl carrier protein